MGARGPEDSCAIRFFGAVVREEGGIIVRARGRLSEEYVRYWRAGG